MNGPFLGPSALLQKRSHQLGDVGSFNSDDQRLSVCPPIPSNASTTHSAVSRWLIIVRDLGKYSCEKYLMLIFNDAHFFSKYLDKCW